MDQVRDSHAVRDAQSTPVARPTAGREGVRTPNRTSSEPGLTYDYAAEGSSLEAGTSRCVTGRDAIPERLVQSGPGPSTAVTTRFGGEVFRDTAGQYDRVQDRTSTSEERRQRRIELERELHELEKAEEWCQATDRMGASFSRPPVYDDRWTREPEFDEWVRGMEESMQASHSKQNGPSQRHVPPPRGCDVVHDGARVALHDGGRMPYEDRTRTTNARQSYPAYTHYERGFGSNPYYPHTTTNPFTFSQTLSQSQATARLISARQGVPRDLPLFYGDVDEWPAFISAYTRTTAACGYTEDENITRVQHALRGLAKETAGHLLAFPDGLKAAMDTLQARFGRPDIIVESLAEKIRKMAIPKLERLESIVEFGFAVRRLIGTVKASGLKGYMYDVALLKELVKKLPAVLCIEWARRRRHLRDITLYEFGLWISELAEDLCGVVDPPKGCENKVEKSTSSNQPHRPTAREQRASPGRSTSAYCNATVLAEGSRTTVNPSGESSSCVLCKGSCSSLETCDRFLKATVATRRAFINERKLCRKCLRYHNVKCSVTSACGVNGCTFLHHALLHLSDVAGDIPEKAHKRNKGSFVNIHSAINEYVLLKYVPVSLHGPKGKVETFAFLDDGSTTTFMEHGLLEELGLKGIPHPLCLQWTGDVSRKEEDSVQVAVRISGRHASATLYELPDVRTVRELALPKQTVNASQLATRYVHMKQIPLESYVDAVPRILIGVDHCRMGRPLKSAEGGIDEPIATKTRLGWVVCGPYSEVSVTPRFSFATFKVCSCEESDGALVAAVKHHFDLESIGIDKTVRLTQSKDNERALMLLERDTKFDGHRYETGLLWRYDDIKLPCNKAAALKRYVCLKQKMSKDLVLAGAVKAKMEEYKTKGYIRRLSNAEMLEKQKRDWYLPIFPVTNPNKPGKIRMVFDAAAKVNGVSLNSLLLAGPDLLAGLLSVLFKFREFRVGVVGDIREMFHRVGMKKEDQRSQMIFWEGDNLNGEPAVYVVTVMTFGAACSPTSAQFAKNRNAERFEKEHPRAVECIKSEHYVDDMLASAETEEEASELATTVRHIHACGGFEIRNWVSNSKKVVEQLQETSATEVNVDMGYDRTTEKVLGMWWNTTSDVFTFRLSPKHDEDLLAGRKPPTKREMLRTQMSVYDPMGLLGHFIMYLKVLLQEVWRSGYSWDQALDGRLADKWATWLRVLPAVEHVTVSRCYRHLSSTSATIELHVFCDASENGMAAVAYFRFEEDGKFECAFVGSKTRVAPLKFLSIPRLELQAAVIGARLAETIRQSHRVEIRRTTFWTDSRNVLSWLHSDHRRYNQFVAFRIGEILENTDGEQWRWVPTKLNVADDGTKWTKEPDLSQSGRWFHGPSFLWKPEGEWPAIEAPARNNPEELRKNVCHHKTVEPWIRFERFSRWKKLLRSIAFVIRFVGNIRNRIQQKIPATGPLTQEELAKAERVLISTIQGEAFPREIECLQTQTAKKHPWEKGVDKASPLYKLSPVVDSDGILKVGGRLSDLLDIDEPMRNPIILPRTHRGTDLLIQECHEKYKHSNHSTVVNELRSRYYIPRLLSEYRRIRRTCQRCKLYYALPAPPLMANVPQQRVAIGQPAFSFTGVDYFGPFLVAVGRRVEKRWGVIFTCLTTRAIHLEMAYSLNTSSCIMAFRRFIARRGTPVEVISDRGTNFVGASRELKDALAEVDNDVLMTEFSGPNMKWTFNPPGAPHFGGCWERLVRSVKTVMTKIDLPRRPTDEVLLSTFAEIELIINSRPLTYVPLDNEMAGPITPNLLLLGSSDGTKPPTPYCAGPTAVKAVWKAAQRNADQFWRKWVAEYLPTLTRRTKWFHPVRPIQEGDIVLIADNNLPRNSWPKGRVISIIRAKDGQVRQATIETVNGTYVRPAHKIAKLDLGV